ncbi:hypothetical protein GOP47_0022929 [Adiantum capillus-veneris]|uniref:Uncharacterized protein n=1 Tax=Adiantum capillus-veneris TaxID=13818 RepID=A0A9D4U6S4_ADICA|nr:hypothetical protein GOP47_0022929 [Adiantum capillus-veneris]
MLLIASSQSSKNAKSTSFFVLLVLNLPRRSWKPTLHTVPSLRAPISQPINYSRDVKSKKAVLVTWSVRSCSNRTFPPASPRTCARTTNEMVHAILEAKRARMDLPQSIFQLVSLPHEETVKLLDAWREHQSLGNKRVVDVYLILELCYIFKDTHDVRELDNDGVEKETELSSKDEDASKQSHDENFVDVVEGDKDISESTIKYLGTMMKIIWLHMRSIKIL